MLDQSIFSTVMKEYLQKHYPELLRDVYDRPDDSFECQLKSPTKHFFIWVASYNCEITLGLQALDGDSGCHTHFTPYTEDDFDGILRNMSLLLDDIMSGKVIYYLSSLSGYSWTRDMETILQMKRPNEEIMFFSWK